MITKQEAVQGLAQVMNVLGLNANETRIECAQRVRDEIEALRGKLREAQQARDAAQTSRRNTEVILSAVFDQIRKLGKVTTGEARSPTDALNMQIAVWTEFERLRKLAAGEQT